MENEIMATEEMMEETTDIAENSSGKGWLIAAGVGAAVLVGGLIYKKLIKPRIEAAKAKKEQPKMVEVTCEEIEAEDVE